MGSESEELKKHNLDSLLFESFPSSDFIFSDNSIANIIQSGRLNLIKDTVVIKLMYQWEAQKNLIKIREDKLDVWISNQMLPFLLKYISFKEMDNYGNFKWSGKSKLKPDYYLLFQQLEFENLLDNAIYYRSQSFNRLEEAESLISKIIKATIRY